MHVLLQGDLRLGGRAGIGYISAVYLLLWLEARCLCQQRAEDSPLSRLFGNRLISLGDQSNDLQLLAPILSSMQKPINMSQKQAPEAASYFFHRDGETTRHLSSQVVERVSTTCLTAHALLRPQPSNSAAETTPTT